MKLSSWSKLYTAALSDVSSETGVVFFMVILCQVGLPVLIGLLTLKE